MRVKCIIFGASKTGSVAYQLLKEKYDIIGFADNNSSKWGEFFCEKEILNPSALSTFENTQIIIASVYYASIYKQLREQGINDVSVFFYMGSATNGVSEKYELYQITGTAFCDCKFDKKKIQKIESDFSCNYSLQREKSNNTTKVADRKKVLFCAYIFPPIGGAGVQRSLKFVKYLREFGYEPIVLTVGENDGKYPLDITMVKEIPDDINVIRVDNKVFLPEMLSQEDQQAIYNLYCGIMKSEKWINEYCDIILNSDARLIPDNQMIWVNECLKNIEEKVNLQDIDIVYTTGCPFSTYFLGYYIKKKYGTKWVQDYRDPWMSSRYYLDHYYDGISKTEQLQIQLEKVLIHYSDAVIAVSNIFNDDKSEHFDIPDEKIHLITNGYDEEDFKNVVTKCDANSKFTLCYNGSVYWDRNPLKLLNDINELISEGQIVDTDITWVFNGEVDISWKRQMETLDNYHIIKYNERLTHLESIKSAMQADLLVLFGSVGEASRIVYTGKVFEYIRMRKPILSFSTEGGVLTDILTETQTGENFEYDDNEGIKKYIVDKYNQWKRGERVSCGDMNAIKKYSRESLTQRLAEIFDVLIKG